MFGASMPPAHGYMTKLKTKKEELQTTANRQSLSLSLWMETQINSAQWPQAFLLPLQSLSLSVLCHCKQLHCCHSSLVMLAMQTSAAFLPPTAKLSSSTIPHCRPLHRIHHQVQAGQYTLGFWCSVCSQFLKSLSSTERMQ